MVAALVATAVAPAGAAPWPIIAGAIGERPSLNSRESFERADSMVFLARNLEEFGLASALRYADRRCRVVMHSDVTVTPYRGRDIRLEVQEIT